MNGNGVCRADPGFARVKDSMDRSDNRGSTEGTDSIYSCDSIDSSHTTTKFCH